MTVIPETLALNASQARGGYIKRGRMEIEWNFLGQGAFWVKVTVNGRIQFAKVLDFYTFGQMFQRAAHWLDEAIIHSPLHKVSPVFHFKPALYPQAG